MYIRIGCGRQRDKVAEGRAVGGFAVDGVFVVLKIGVAVEFLLWFIVIIFTDTFGDKGDGPQTLFIQ